MAEPITGTTEFIANLAERKPNASAREATAVFIDSIETNTVAQTEMPTVMYRFKVSVIEVK